MKVTDSQEVWQVEAGGQIFETRFDEMVQWIFEGSLLPQDLVRRGNLRWIEARKVPNLTQFFNAKERGEQPPVSISTTDAQNSSAQAQVLTPEQTVAVNPFQTTIVQPAEIVQPPVQNSFSSPQNFHHQTNWQEPQYFQPASEPAPHEFNMMPTADACAMHADVASAFLCGTCGNEFCATCVKSYGGTVKICPFCGAMCKSVKEVTAKTSAAVRYERDLAKGFGFEDFGNALAYPFKFKTSLIIGAIMFVFFTLGQGATGMGSIFLAGGGLFCWMAANMLTFGVLANTVENFAQGKIGGNFMPSFDEFSLWDDMIHPFFLSIGVYLVSFGLVILIIFGGILWGLNQASNAISDSYTTSQSAPGLTDKNGPIKNNPGFQQQEKLYGDGEMPDEGTINGSQKYVDDTEEDVRRANDMINDYRKKQVEAGLGKSPETEQRERDLMIQNFMQIGVPLLLLVGLGFLWGIFYMPAACCVAGYTRSFVATMNPMVGIETIKLLGWDYVKICLMSFALVIISAVLSLILGVLLSAFDMPTVGNIPVKIIGGVFTFYFSVVFSVILGFALYKNADKMNLFKG